MQKFLAAIFAASLTTPMFAGALLLQAADPKANPEAMAKNAVVVARMTACHSPEKTTVVATAEGVVDGQRQSIPLKVINLSTPGTYAVAHEWPKHGAWTVKMVATNPDYKDYATGFVVPIRNDAFSREGAKEFFHAPTSEEVASVLKQATID